MKLESLSFDQARLDEFLRDQMEHDRGLLVRRLELAAERLAELSTKVPGAGAEGEDWNAREVLAHIAVLSKFYGVAAKRIAEGAWTQIDLLAMVTQRDVAGEATAKLPVDEIAAMAAGNLGKTLEFLRGADVESLYRRATVAEDRTLSAEEFLRLALCSHVETHLDQLERALA